MSISRLYAGILGLTAMNVSLLRNATDAVDAADTMMAGTISLVAFFLAGLLVGNVAEKTVRESVRRQFEDRIALQSQANDQPLA